MEIKFGIITCSDTRTIEEDTAGAFLEQSIKDNGWQCLNHEVVKDNIEAISNAIIKNVDEFMCDIVLTCGGTGLSPKDVTPEATQKVCQRNVSGIAEAMRAYGLKITPNAALSRALCMQRGTCLVINFPGSEKAAKENWEAACPMLEHAVKMSQGGGH